MAPNLALISIPAYYLLSTVPHAYAIAIASNGDRLSLDNTNPRGLSQAEKFRKTLPAEQFARYERAEAAHKNNHENLPLYVAAVFAGLLAEQATKGTIGKTYVSSGVSTGLMKFVYGWFAIRIAYNLLYINTTTRQWAYMRSALYLLGTAMAFGQIWSASKVLGY